MTKIDVKIKKKPGRKKKMTIAEAEELLMETDPVILETDPKAKERVPLGTMVAVTIPNFSHPTRVLMRKQVAEGKVKEFGQIALEDGTILELDKAHVVPLTFEIKEMLKNSILMGGGRVIV